jgi:hypothetical protein
MSCIWWYMCVVKVQLDNRSSAHPGKWRFGKWRVVKVRSFRNMTLRKISFDSAKLPSMALPSGIYTIQNVKYRNWAMLLNANEGEVVAGSSASTNVGEKVSLSNIRNHQRRLNKSCSGSSTDWQMGHILCRINSTIPIMRVTPILISRRTRPQFRAFGTPD